MLGKKGAPMKKNTGFTFSEVLIVVAIVGILAAIALPAYNAYVQRGNRLDAKTSLESLRFAQEKWRSNNITYGGLADVWNGTATKSGHYGLSVVSSDSAGFVATATPLGAQLQDECGTFAIDQDGPLTSGYASKDCWAR